MKPKLTKKEFIIIDTALMLASEHLRDCPPIDQSHMYENDGRTGELKHLILSKEDIETIAEEMMVISRKISRHINGVQ